MHGGTSGIDGLFQDEHIAGSMLHRAGGADGLAAGDGASDWSGRT
jgi:hypothetical protein